MDIEHFGFLSSVIRKTESHEQDGETLLREPGARSTTASGDPAMACFLPRLARTDLSVRLYSAAFRSCRTTAGRARLQRARKMMPRAKRLASDAELIDQCLVAPLIGALEIVEQLAALRDHLEKAAPRMVVFHMRLEVFGQGVDPLREDRNLHLGRACVVLGRGIRFDDFGLAAGR